MSLTFHNTLTRRLEPFEPLEPGRVSLYTCGPTVWNFAHIGNFRTFLFEDLLRRWLEASGYDVYHIMNVTDVDDRTINAAAAAGTSLREHVQPFIDAFYADRDYLRIRPANEYPRATEFIAPMIRLVQGLIDKGHAYRADDGSVYFKIASFPAYGRLSQLDRQQLQAGAGSGGDRAGVDTDEYAKEDARDFALWKAARPADEQVGAAWDAPFGRGRPGWHLECSAMALELVGQQYGVDVVDIHAGGVDLIFPHHEDEIAQSCAYTGQEHFARYWLHGEFLNVRGTKMSKRFGNFLTVRDLSEQGVGSGAVRLLVFQTHYRQRLDWTDQALEGAREGSRRLGEFGRKLAEASERSGKGPTEPFEDAAGRFGDAFKSALDEDLNAPRAVAALFDFAREGNRLLDEGVRPGPRALGAWALAGAVLDCAQAVERVSLAGSDAAGLAESATRSSSPPAEPPTGAAEAADWAWKWALVRLERKKARDFGEADRIRDLLREHGFEVRDTKDGGVEVVRRD
ncbi:MAG TPA: cysteine--tRNA ligase [Gemmatimonadales bacterium]|nr:cysteine--tRNA ligase [Gemmatimonadales bacterium]